MRLVPCSRWLTRVYSTLAGVWLLAGTPTASGKACVWRVSDGTHALYLAGSVHALRASDAPFPPEYTDAYNASSGLAFETDLTVPGERWAAAIERAGTLPANVTLRDKVDPRTYAYMQRVVAKFHGGSTEGLQRIEHLKPWVISWMLDSPTGKVPGLSGAHGVEPYFLTRAKKDHKKIAGLVPFDEHVAVFGDMNDADSEAELLLAFIQLDKRNTAFDKTVAAWKRGDIASIDRDFDEEYRDAPSLRRRLLSDRNHRWLPTIEGYLHSGKTWMIVAGAGHMAGREGLPTLLQGRGYQVEQL